jgi:transcriptional regulator with XRE-family HTH domain
LLELLILARRQGGLTQQAVAERLDRPQSFVAKYENGERRLDVLEFLAVARALEADPVGLLVGFITGEPSRKRARSRSAPPNRGTGSQKARSG